MPRKTLFSTLLVIFFTNGVLVYPDAVDMADLGDQVDITLYLNAFLKLGQYQLTNYTPSPLEGRK
ncbi:MAG: hypothetical protein OSA23_12970 [Rhodospirillales bacterium]|nr:hypothetical protein [Rhodospirillales bacterium]